MGEINVSLILHSDDYEVSGVLYDVLFFFFLNLTITCPFILNWEQTVSFIACSKMLDIFELQKTQNFIEQTGSLTKSKNSVRSGKWH